MFKLFDVLCCEMRKCRNIADLVDEKKKPKIGETSSSFETLPMSYAKSTDRFLEDSESSLQRRTEKIKKARRI